MILESELLLRVILTSFVLVRHDAGVRGGRWEQLNKPSRGDKLVSEEKKRISHPLSYRLSLIARYRSRGHPPSWIQTPPSQSTVRLN